LKLNALLYSLQIGNYPILNYFIKTFWTEKEISREKTKKFRICSELIKGKDLVSIFNKLKFSMGTAFYICWSRL